MEEVLDSPEEVPIVRPPVWPSIIMGGLAGAALLVFYNKISLGATYLTSLLINLLLTFIVLNTTLNHYRGKKGSFKSLQIAIYISYATYLLMMVTYIAIAKWWMTELGAVFYEVTLLYIIYFLLAGVVISIVAAALSRRPGTGEV